MKIECFFGGEFVFVILFLDYELLVVFCMLFVFSDCLIDDAQTKLRFCGSKIGIYGPFRFETKFFSYSFQVF